MNIKFEELVGKPGILCAVDDLKFRIGDLTFEAIEDESDGYRSSLAEFKLVENIRPTIREKVTITTDEGEYFYLTNKIGKVVLTVGTDYADDYYPCFVFNWEPINLSTYVDVDSLLNTITE